MFKEFLVFFCIVAVAWAGISRGPLPEKPEKFKDVEGCYIKDMDMVIPFGKSAPCTKHCMEYRCSTTMIQYVTCGVAVASGNDMKVVEDHSKPYPECCPRVVEA